MRVGILRRPGLASEAEVLDRVHRVLGPVELLDDVSVRPQVCKILKIETRSGEQSFVKWYAEASDYQRECDALSQYTPALGTDAPRLIAEDEALQMVLISRVQGEIATATQSHWDPLIHYRAGELVRRLHEASPPVVSDQFVRQSAQRFEDAASQLEGKVESSLLAEARLFIARAMDISPVALVPTHRENHPRHWVVDPGGHVRLIDFGMCEYDPWIVDVFPLEQDYWRVDPQLRSAFLGGYDRDIEDDDIALLRAHHAVTALQALVSATATGATKTQKIRARDMFDRLIGHTLF
jgi:Ser/Thr protein kinase RdoA (MazF antagonist)